MVENEGPQVTIGLPVFNGEAYLGEAIDSLLSQTFTDLELVIADNASSDGTREICEHYRATDPRVRYFRHATNLGAAPNYNFTVDQARGEFFMWAAHDDVRKPTFVQEALDAFQANPEAAVVFSKAERIDQLGERRGDLPRHDAITSDHPWERFEAAITCRHPALVVFGLMRLSGLNATGRHGAYPGADRVLAAELALQGSLIEVPEVLFQSRDHPTRYVRLGRRAGRLAQSTWWDSSRGGRVDVPALKRLMAYRRAIASSGMSDLERRRCRAALIRAALDSRGAILRELGGDLLRAGRQQVVRLVRQRDEPTGHSP